jgi:tetratricopeptide (TPR) repeat protein
MEKSVQQQMRERDALLRLKIENPETPTVELGNAYGEMGKLLMAAEYFDAAESCYLNAQALVPAEARWPYYLGHVYRTRGEPAKSAASFERALELQPSDVATLVWLGGVYLQQDRPEAAEPLFTKALSLQPRSVAALFGLGRVALAKRDYARAVEHLEAALTLGPQASIIHYPLAMAYRGLGEPDKAEVHLRQRGDVEVGPADPWMQELSGVLQSAVAYENRGVRALGSGEYAAAASYFRKGLELAPDSPSLRHGLGTALSLTGDAQGALEQFTETVRRSPEFAKGQYSLGVLLASKGRLPEAIERFSAAVKSEPNYVEAHLQLAEALRRSGRADQALPHYEHVITLDPRVAEAPFGYAMALVRLKRYQAARDVLTEGMKLHPDQPAIAHALARLLAAAPDDRVRDGRRAMVVMQSLLKMPRSTDLGETMAMTLAELGQYEEAVAWQHEAMAAAERGGRADLVQRMAENLGLYQRHMPCRTPWRDDDR